MGILRGIGLGAVGWIFLGPIGGIFGFLFGSMYDGMLKEQAAKGAQQTQKGDFVFSLLVLTASVMKADGKVLKSELNFVKDFFKQNFGTSQAADYIITLREILKQEYDVIEIARQIGQYMDYPSRTQLLQYLFELAKSDNYVHPKEVELIEKISRNMGIRDAEFLSLKEMFFEEIENHYRILEVAVSATDEEVKAAYRKKVKENHPDKLAHLGPEIQKAANERLQKINEAYEKIKRERGIN